MVRTLFHSVPELGNNGTMWRQLSELFPQLNELLRDRVDWFAVQFKESALEFFNEYFCCGCTY